MGLDGKLLCARQKHSTQNDYTKPSFMMKFIRHSGSTDSIVIYMYRQTNRLTDRYKYNKTDTMKTNIKKED